MSETVIYRGKLQKLDVTDKEQFSLDMLSTYNIPRNTFWDTAYEQLREDLYDEFIILKDNTIYKVLSKSDNEIDDDIFELTSNEDGTFNYLVMYYNGGCGFSEAIEYAVTEYNETKEIDK